MVLHVLLKLLKFIQINMLRNHFIKAQLTSSEPSIPSLPQYYIHYTSTSGQVSLIINEFGSNIIGHYYDDSYNCYFIVFQSPVQFIGDYVFYKFSTLTSIVIPDSVTIIGGWAFRGCSSLTSIVIGNSVTSIGQAAFAGCPITSIVIPNSVTSIEQDTFWLCKSLTSVTIPENVTRIGRSAFGGCSSLTSITFNGTKAQWKGINLGTNWKQDVPAKVVHCTDGDVTL